MDYHTAKATATELIRGAHNSPNTAGSLLEADEKLQRRERLRLQLQQLALTSDTGTASVVEVIEPDSSEEEELKKTFSWSPAMSQQQNIIVTSAPNSNTTIVTDITVTSANSMDSSSGQMSLLPSMYGVTSNTGKHTSSMMLNKSSGSMSLALSPSGQPLGTPDYGHTSLKDPAVITNSQQDNTSRWNKTHRGGRISDNYNQMYISKRSTTSSNGQLNISATKPKFQSLDVNGRKMSEPDILHGVQAFSRNNERRNSANILDEIKPENGEEEIFGDYDPESMSSELLAERGPDSLFVAGGGRSKRGFLKKLSIAKWAGRRKSGKDGREIESDSESYSATPLRKSVDDLRQDGVGQESFVAARARDHSVTRIQVPSTSIPGRSPGNGAIRQTRGGKYGIKNSMAKSDDSGIIATSSRPDSSLSTPAIRKSYSGSSDNSDLSSRSGGGDSSLSSGKHEVRSTTSTIQLNGGNTSGGQTEARILNSSQSESRNNSPASQLGGDMLDSSADVSTS
ncbi:MAG: hypothetical protein GY696_12780, partial [Gammaproteobacteria bacterium]|nr:hypothetical protein [Gammaproteobacteria bacterium]